MKKFNLILIIFIILISCSKIQEKKRIGIKNNNRFRMKAFTPEDIPLFKTIYKENPIIEIKDKKIRTRLYSCENAGEGADGAVYMKNNFLYTTGDYQERSKKTRKFDLIIKYNRIELIKISEWKQTKVEKQMEQYFFKQFWGKKFLSYFFNITDEKIAQFIPEGVAIRFYKKLDFNRDGKPDYFVIFSYPFYYDDTGLNEEIMLYIILSHNNGYSIQSKRRMGVSLLCSIVDVEVYKNKFVFISQISPSRTGGGYFYLYWYK